MNEMQKRLQEFIEKSDAPYEWGVSDCSTWPAQWLSEEFGVKVDIPEYGSKEEAHRLIDKAGDLCSIWRPLARDAGLLRVHHPDAGDVGIVQFRSYQVGVIFVSDRIAYWRAEKGAIAIDGLAALVCAWRA